MPDKAQPASPRTALQIAIAAFGEKMCVYAGGEWPHFCDCKYGMTQVGGHSETGNGCPEMRGIFNRVTEVESQLAAAVELLRELSRVKAGNGQRYCPLCSAHISVRHAPNCRLAVFLAQFPQ